jgi:hypothetical protein
MELDILRKPQGDPLVIVMQLEEIAAKLDKLQETLDRIEERQKRTTAMVEDVKKKEAPTTLYQKEVQKEV